MMRSAFVSDEFDSGPWTAPQAKKPPAGDGHGSHPGHSARRCPHGRQTYSASVDDEQLRRVDRVLTRAVHQGVFGLMLFAFGLVRCVRLLVASVFHLIGRLGDVFTVLARRIAHPDDRRFFQKRGQQRG